MIVSMFHLRVAGEAMAGFERSWQQRARMVDAMPGFRGLEVLRDGNEPGHYIVVSRWETQGDYANWVGSPQFIAGHARSDGGAAQGQGIEFYEVLPGTA
jgi:heme-degrading monooxygenase HmoA